VSLIDEALNQIQHLSSYTQIKLVKELKKEDTIIGDSLRLRIIFNNIISNAYKYFDPEKPNPFFKIAFNKTEQEVHIIFEDNGLGIDEPFIPRIFEMFYRATHKAEGTGIGLFIVKESVEKMGGRIECSSILGEGSRFDVILPM
jgi:signal transduction histidine kinase